MSQSTAPAVILKGIFSDPDGLNRAVQSLRRSGFEKTQVSAVLVRRKEAAEAVPAVSFGSKVLEVGKRCRGALRAGAAAGGAAGLLSSLRLFPTPPARLYRALLGAACGTAVGVVMGVVSGALGGFPKPAASAQEGTILLLIKCGDRSRASTARQILEQSGANPISEVPEEESSYDEARFAERNQA